MPIIAVLALVLLFLAAVGNSWFWRPPAPAAWYGDALFYWGVFFLAVCLEWPILKSLGV